MAITIQQEPTTPNQANADLIYLLSSTNSNQPQFQFVMEVSDGSDTYTFLQQPNPNDRAVFDLGQVAPDFLNYDTPWKTKFVTTSTNTYAKVSIADLTLAQDSGSVCGSVSMTVESIYGNSCVYFLTYVEP